MNVLDETFVDMNLNEARIIFLGTPAFAVASLDALVKAKANIVAVVTVPDKPAGRGMKITQSAVKQYAIEHNLLVLQPEKLREASFVETLQSLKADLQVVVAFRMLPEVVWNMPKMGTINLHASLLPQYRGAAPINWAIINGEKETGVTTFLLQHAIDTGNILLQEKVTIAPMDNAGTLHDKLMKVGAQLVVKTVEGLCQKTIKEVPQPSAENLPTASKIFKETCALDFNQAAEAIHNKVRGLSPFPTAFTYMEGKLLKVYATSVETVAHQEPIGTYHTDEKTFLKIACLDGFVHLLDVQAEGKKRMPIADFLRGFRKKHNE